MNRLCARALPLLALLTFPMPAMCQMTAYLFVWDGTSATEVFTFPLPETTPVETVEPTRRLVLDVNVRATAVDNLGRLVVLLDGSPPAVFDLDIVMLLYFIIYSSNNVGYYFIVNFRVPSFCGLRSSGFVAFFLTSGCSFGAVSR